MGQDGNEAFLLDQLEPVPPGAGKAELGKLHEQVAAVVAERLFLLKRLFKMVVQHVFRRQAQVEIPVRQCIQKLLEAGL